MKLGTYITTGMMGAVLLSACATTSGQQFDSSAIDSIKIGQTTTSQTLAALGEPYSRNVSADGTEAWRYFQFEGKTGINAASFIPVAGSFLGESKTKTKSQILELNFTDDVLAKCLFRIENSSTREGMALSMKGSTGGTTSKEIACGQ